MTAPYGLSIPIYERTLTSSPGVFVTSLQDRIDSYEHTISATFGFETMRVSFTATPEEALDWLLNGLFRSTIVTGPDADTIFEGYLETIEAQFGQERRSVSLGDGFANRVRVRYTTVLGSPGTTATASDTTSQALYGIKDDVLSLGEDSATAAQQKRDTELARRKNPVSKPAAEVASGDLGAVQVSLTFAGWYTTLGWILTSRTDTSTEATTTQAGALIGTSSPGIGATNAFLSTSTANIAASGISSSRYIAPDTSYRQKIEALLIQGNGTHRFAWGVYEDRKLKVAQWAGATPTTITYQRYLGDTTVYDAAGMVVQPWAVRPDAMYQVVDLLDVGPIATAQDAPARFYVERVTCKIDQSGTSVSLEPQMSDSLDAILARA